MRKCGAIIAALLMAGCAGTVTGKVQGTGESFTGTAVADGKHGGTVSLRSNTGVTCQGDYLFSEKRKGEGVFNCTDGRSGPFSFVSNGFQGLGHGTLDGQGFTFKFSI